MPSETLDRFEKAIRLSDVKKPLYGKLIWFYKKKISPVQARRCPYYPSCSTYTLYSMKKYGFLWGFFMGLERLYLRENTDALRKIHYLPVNMGGAEIAYDPPEANYIFGKKDWRTLHPDFRHLLFTN